MRAVANGYDWKYMDFFNGLTKGLTMKTDDIYESLGLSELEKIKIKRGSPWTKYPKNAEPGDLFQLINWLYECVEESGRETYELAIQGLDYDGGLGFVLVVRQKGFGEPFVAWITSKAAAKLFGERGEMMD